MGAMPSMAGIFQKLTGAALAASLLLQSVPASAQGAQSFTDVPPKHPAYAALEYLRARGIVQGYDDGSFHPDAVVNRAESLKLILSPVLPAESLALYTKSPFTDVPAGAWFLPYVEAGRTVLGVVSGPPEKPAFRPGDPVNLGEFLKLFLLTQRVDAVGAYAELVSPLSSDVKPTDWFFPYVRYGVSSSMILVNADGTFGPATKLTRGEIAVMMHRYFMYKDKRRTQSLLSEAESEIINVASMIDKEDVDQAGYAAARATVAARGALSKEPNQPLVKGAVKTAEGFSQLAEAFRAGKEGRLDDAIALAGQAWNTAEKVRGFSASLDGVAGQMQSLAKKMADGARQAKEAA